MDKITITRDDVKKVVGFAAQLGCAGVVGRIMGTFGPKNKLARCVTAIGSSCAAVALMDPIQAAADRVVDSWCTLFDLFKERIEIREDDPDNVVDFQTTL